MNFEQTGPTAGDCMTPYKVTGEYPRVVRDFVEYVLKKFPEEWGAFHIYTSMEKSLFNGPSTEYRYAKLLGKLPEECANLNIKKVNCSAGWSCTHYYIYTEE